MNNASRNCCWKGCEASGEYPAPRLRQMPISYESPFSVADDTPLQRDFYCMQHIKEFNKSWDFFRGMSDKEVEAFQKDAVTGHRRTRKIQPHVVAGAYRAAEGVRSGKTSTKKSPSMPVRVSTAEEREALAVFGLEHPVTEAEVKRRYRELVKQYHPDRIGKTGEEKIKVINHAYTCLQSVYI